MKDKDTSRLPEKSARRAIDSFLRQVASLPTLKPGGQRGRLIFALDATASREPTWDQACRIQARMFTETASLGGLDIQLCYYRGFQEFEATAWLHEPDALLRHMTAVHCLGGYTQIDKVLSHAVEEGRATRVHALVFVGDCMEEDSDRLCHRAGELGILGIPAFVFQEGGDQVAERVFRQIARLSNGAYCRFDSSSPRQLRDLLSAVAVYAAGGRAALDDFSRQRGGIVLQLSHQVRKG
ncbi:MAG: VWA domain-containing protein [Beijerinckiaceae bacterium]|nr:VWA domain-containing protein [Beijerinckiaceae bacterium]